MTQATGNVCWSGAWTASPPISPTGSRSFFGNAASCFDRQAEHNELFECFLKGPRNMLRSILAVIAGFLTWGMCRGIFDRALGALMAEEHRQSGNMALFIEIAADLLFAIFGGYVTALGAKHSEALHAAALSALVLIWGIATVATQYESKPLWSHIGLTTAGVLGVLVGGWLRVAQKKRTASPESPQPRTNNMS